MSPRATPMSPDERRKAIVRAVVPLVAERGSALSTREIAEAAGVAEGTIFRVFADKRELMLAVAREAIDPSEGQARFEEALAAIPDLRDKIVRTSTSVLERMRMTMSVMYACREHLVAAHAEHTDDGHAGAEHGGHGGHGGHDQHGEHRGPPEFVLKAQQNLTMRLTALFEPHRDELAVDPTVAAVALRSLIFGAARPELGLSPALTPEQIADLVLDGVRTRTHHDDGGK